MILDDLAPIEPVMPLYEDDEADADPGKPADELPFDANLAEYLDEGTRDAIVEEYLDLIEGDKSSREDWDKISARGQQMMGLTIRDEDLEKAAPDKTGTRRWWSATTTHPILAEAITRFQAQASGELFPPEGPAKGHTFGTKKTKALEDQADRVAAMINWIATDELPEFGDQTEKLLFLTALEGGGYAKNCADPATYIKRQIVRTGDVYLPWHAGSFYEADRATHRMSWSPKRIKRLQASGDIRKDVVLGEGKPERGEAERQADKAIGLNADGATRQDDAPIEIYECYAKDMFSGPGLPEVEAPYVLTIAKDDRELLALRRNWIPSSGARMKPWRLLTPYSFIPGDHPGPYAYGLVHLIGSLSDAATTLLRSALDIAAFSAKPAGLILQVLLNDPRFDTSPLEPGEYRGVPATIEDIKRGFMTLPVGDINAVSQVLQFIVQTAQRFASTADLQVGAGDNRAPVGTTLALLEKGSEIYTSIHRRLHRAQRQELKTIAALIGEYAQPDQPYPFPVDAEEGVTPTVREDFDQRVDVAPVSDPHISSSTQRLAIAQGTTQLATQFPQDMDSRKACRAMLQAMRQPDADDFLKKIEDAPRADAVSENMRVLFGQPVRARYDQDHAAHLAVHQQWFGSLPPEAQQVVQPVFMAHMGEHMAFAYRAQMEQGIAEITASLPGELLPPPPQPTSPGEEDDEAVELPPDIERLIDAAAAQVAQVMAQQQQAAAQAPEDADRQLKREEMALKDKQASERLETEAAIAAGELEHKGRVDGAKLDIEREKMARGAASEAAGLLMQSQQQKEADR